METLHGRLGSPVRAAVVRCPGRPAPRGARGDADRVLDALLALMDEHADTHDPALDALLAHDRRHGTDLAESPLRRPDGVGGTMATARGLHIHPNTLRRLLRARPGRWSPAGRQPTVTVNGPARTE